VLSSGSLTGGLVIGGAGSTRVLIRAVGPTLQSFGVAGAAADTAMVVRSGTTVLASNDSWAAGSNAPAVEAASRAVGAFPLGVGSQDAAVVATLPAGSYTVEVTAAGEGGVVLLEVYELP
jgi:hypothetical protein